MTWLEAVKDEAAKHGRVLDDDGAEYILWEHTGFPGFWQIGVDGATPEECLRKQVRRALGVETASGAGGRDGG